MTKDTTKVRIAYHPRLDRELAVLRGVSLVCTLGGLFWLYSSHQGRHWSVWLAFLLAVSGAFAWLLLLRKGLLRLSGKQPLGHLEAGRLGISWQQKESHIFVDWRDIAGVEVNEENLHVRIKKTDGTSHEIPPYFGDQGAYKLAETLRSRQPTKAK